MYQNVPSDKKGIIKSLQSYYKDVKDFKSFFIDRSGIIKGHEIYKIWAHWLIRNLCEKDYNYHIIPNQLVAADSEIIQHFVDKGGDPVYIRQFYNDVITRANMLYNKYNQIRTEISKNYTLLAEVSQMITYAPQTKINSVNGDQYLYHTFYFGKTYVKFPEEVFESVKQRYNGPENCFTYFVFDMGFNYYILEGHGFQWSVPPSVFSLLKDQLNLSMECFASPLNASLPLFCSLFEVDTKFGALDNFFNLVLDQSLEGCFEMNPPFIEKIFERSSDRVINFIERSQKDGKYLMFIYVMPSWTDCIGYQTLSESPFLIDEMTLDRDQHYYFQNHNKKMICANFITHILLIGTTAAKQHWQETTPSTKAEMISRFKGQDIEHSEHSEHSEVSQPT